VTPPSRPILAVVACSLPSAADLERLLPTLVSLRVSAPALRVLVVEEGMAPPAVGAQLSAIAGELGMEIELRAARGERPAPATARNVGLARALADGHDALLIADDLEFRSPGWVERMAARADGAGRPAAVVGARLLRPEGIVDSAGLQFSLLTREFIPRLRFAPAATPEALAPTRCPVPFTLALLRAETLAAVGLLDETFPSRWEDVDYCLRVFEAGLECIYEPSVVAFRTGELPLRPVRPEPDEAVRMTRSDQRLFDKHSGADLGRGVPEV
jgi:hypothetical protein